MQRGQFFFEASATDNNLRWLAAWPLFSPAVPEYGSWSWLFVRIRSERFQKRYHHQSKWRVQFVRPMTEDEVRVIANEYMVWGEKIPDHPWALVAGRPGQGSHHASVTVSHDSSRSIGV